MDWYIALYKQIEDYARSMSENIVCRYDINGSSCDERRAATPEERKIIFSVISGALHDVRYHGISVDGKKPDFEDILQNAADTAEFIGDSLFDGEFEDCRVNGYDTFYLPIKRFKWETEIERS